MNLKCIRLRINDLIDQHGNSYGNCPGCPGCTEIKRLRKSLDRDPAEKFKHILDKGQDMTKSEIAFLLENDVQKKLIAKAVGMSLTPFYKLLENYGFGKPKEEIEMGKLEMTAEEFVDLRYKQQLTFLKIAQLKGVSDPSVHNWKDRHADEIKKVLKALNFPLQAEKTTTTKTIPGVKKVVTTEIKAPESKAIKESINEAFTEKSSEYERLIAALRNDLSEAHKQLDEKDEKIRNLEHLHNAFEDTENELLKVEKEKEVLQSKYEWLQDTVKGQYKKIEELKLQVNPLEEENHILRQLIKKWA